MRQHGTSARYNHGPDVDGVEGRGCRCGECTEAVRLYRAHRRSEGTVMVSSHAARKALRDLQRFGWSRTSIVEELGLGAQQNLLKHDRCTRRVHDGVTGLRDRVKRERRLRFSFDPLASVLAARGCAARAAQARWLEVDNRQLYRWIDGGVPLPVADRLACSLNYHPSELWPEYLDEPAPVIPIRKEAA